MKKLYQLTTLLIALMLSHSISAQQWNNVGNAGFSAGSTEYNDMALDGSGTPYVVFRDNNNSGKVTGMKFNGNTWETVGTAGFSADAASYISMAINSNGIPYVAYKDFGTSGNGGITVKKFNGTVWETVGSEGFSGSYISYTDIAFSSNGTPYVVYSSGGSTNKPTVKKFDGNNWVTVGNPAFSTSYVGSTCIAINSNDIIYVGYRDGGGNSDKATVMKFNDSSNTWETVGSAKFSSGPAYGLNIAINNNNTLYVVYSDDGNGLKATAMKFNGTAWVSVGNANGFSASYAAYTDIAINNTGTPYVVYRDGGNTLKATVMKFNDGANAWETVGSAGFSAGNADYTSIAINSSDDLYVAYKDGGNSNKATVMKYSTSNPSIPLSDWALYSGIFLIIGFVVIRYLKDMV